LNPSVALVTGASRGIGREVAIALARRGVRIAVHYRQDAPGAQETIALLSGEGHRHYAADLADADQCAALCDSVLAELGSIDILINNAAAIVDHPPLSTTYEEWRSAWQTTLATNLLGPANLSMRVAQAMIGRAPTSIGRARIVNVSSRGAFRGEPDAPAYGASKAGLNSLGQSLAKALAPHAIYVYALAPGWVRTDMAVGYLSGPRGEEILAQHPLGRVAEPEEVAAAAAFCALDAPPAMTGAIIDVNGASYLRT
jgi:3-oxoacyl-[acyl-carrier protein] reductase